jgi:hypothetical protein
MKPVNIFHAVTHFLLAALLVASVVAHDPLHPITMVMLALVIATDGLASLIRS